MGNNEFKDSIRVTPKDTFSNIFSPQNLLANQLRDMADGIKSGRINLTDEDVQEIGLLLSQAERRSKVSSVLRPRSELQRDINAYAESVQRAARSGEEENPEEGKALKNLNVWIQEDIEI